MPENTAEAWLTPEEAAAHLGVGRATVFRWMREGKLSHVKVGRSTRFRLRDLDAVQRQVVAKDAAGQIASRCAACGHGFLLPGSARSTGMLYFQPERTKFWVLSESMVELRAYACPICGHVQMHADTEKIRKLMKPEDAEASRAAGTNDNNAPAADPSAKARGAKADERRLTPMGDNNNDSATDAHR
jgi:excisionase family DNA binding protein